MTLQAAYTKHTARWLAVAGLLLTLWASPVTADPASLVTLKGKVDSIEGNQLLLNDFALVLTANTQVYTAKGARSEVGQLRAGMRIEAVVRSQDRTVQIINLLR